MIQSYHLSNYHHEIEFTSFCVFLCLFADFQSIFPAFCRKSTTTQSNLVSTNVFILLSMGIWSDTLQYVSILQCSFVYVVKLQFSSFFHRFLLLLLQMKNVKNGTIVYVKCFMGQSMSIPNQNSSL